MEQLSKLNTSRVEKKIGAAVVAMVLLKFEKARSVQFAQLLHDFIKNLSF